ncbi:lipid-binding SYLF domain-containing protein [Rhodopila sp.]|uniref:lipid-binding SYLF domain-containing protein n=1 Tax=Rhodopila sp. TaxID=2480087 RepID=UPI002BA040F2|nr:lipid-binding SYLF domain-containing protein [Rhodopila sp.]HVZ10707.1 lipid-binding SYLF domain-containing protein [Rhodopila sp.]
MTISRRAVVLGATALAGSAASTQVTAAQAASAGEISSAAHRALELLYREQPRTREIGKRAVAVLVFPKIYKGGVIIGGQTGDGALLVRGATEAFYNISAASFGLQLGGQTFSYVLFFMNERALDYLRKSDGWALGSGPTVVVMDQGRAASLTTTTLTQDVYAFPFGEKGLMAGLNVEGSKITRIQPGR